MYPKHNEIQTIAEWDYGNFSGLMDYVKEKWEYAEDGYWQQEDDTYYLSTAGWSGNEDIVQALKENYMFWSLCWERSERGGRYKFVLPSNFK
jgi:hypothetical protein